MTLIMPGDSACGLQERIIEELVAKDPDARFHQHQLCSMCKKAVSQSGIIAGDLRELRDQADVSLPRWQPGMRSRFIEETMDDASLPSWPVNNEEVRFLEETIDHYQDVDSVLGSIREGCHMCSLLCASTQDGHLSTSASLVNDWRVDDLQARLVLRVSCQACKYDGRLRKDCGKMGLWKRYLHGGENEYGSDRRIRVIQDLPKFNRNSDLDKTAIDTLFSLSTCSTASFRWVKLLLETCHSEHASCLKSYLSANQIPTRLLELDGVESRGTIRLVAEDFPKSPRLEYMTLSHRWGNRPTTRLLQSNESAFKRSISVGSLPLTFQHAIIATIRLGYRYLWVDSLCIIQDSPTDWEHESAIMGDIYRGSICTIAASSAMDSQEGFFSSRNPLLYQSCRLTDEIGLSGYRSLPPDHLSSRGWVVQERALSPRTVSYGRGTISWECVETQVEEQGVKERTDQPKNRFYNLTLIELEKIDLTGPHSFAPSDSLLMFHTYWTKFLGMYTGTTLTRPADKLVAINGIISRIERSAHLKSLAGLWREMLPAELLWNAEHPNRMLLAHEYRAPSWSWAYLDGPITNKFVKMVKNAHQWKWMIDVVEAKATSLPNGQVSAAHLLINGPLRRVREAKSNTDGQQQESVPRAKLWIPDNGINDANEELWALLVARAGTSGLRETASGLELSEKDVGLIITPVDENRTAFQRRGYYEEGFWPSDNRHIFRGDVDQDVKTFAFL